MQARHGRLIWVWPGLARLCWRPAPFAAVGLAARTGRPAPATSSPRRSLPAPRAVADRCSPARESPLAVTLLAGSPAEPPLFRSPAFAAHGPAAPWPSHGSLPALANGLVPAKPWAARPFNDEALARRCLPASLLRPAPAGEAPLVARRPLNAPARGSAYRPRQRALGVRDVSPVARSSSATGQCRAAPPQAAWPIVSAGRRQAVRCPGRRVSAGERRCRCPVCPTPLDSRPPRLARRSAAGASQSSRRHATDQAPAAAPAFARPSLSCARCRNRPGAARRLCLARVRRAFWRRTPHARSIGRHRRLVRSSANADRGLARRLGVGDRWRDATATSRPTTHRRRPPGPCQAASTDSSGSKMNVNSVAPGVDRRSENRSSALPGTPR